MAEENSDGILFVLESVVKCSLPDEGVDQMAVRSTSMIGIEMRNAINGVGDAIVPLFGVSRRKQHFCIGIELHEFFVKSAGGPIYCCLVALKNGVPISRLSTDNGVPLCVHTWFVKEF